MLRLLDLRDDVLIAEVLDCDFEAVTVLLVTLAMDFRLLK